MEAIDGTYFNGELNIPNAGVKGSGVEDLLDWLIAKHQEPFLQSIMGYELYKAFTAGIAVTPTPEQKWKDILDGKEYTNLSGRLHKWNGLVFKSADDSPRSPVANYIYYLFIKNNHTQTAAMGEVKGTAENSVVANPTLKMVAAWNDMVIMLEELWLFINSNRETYTEWDNTDTYCIYKKYGKINQFGI